ncbi:MAG: cysteine dioxygenase family protein [Rubrobacter sp.]|jgi:predicted metal-dependent enzyme (double-stranded beta helix superfamily)|nr:cysteine dioxygenase family protein [Rubrobacter sp.]
MLLTQNTSKSNDLFGPPLGLTMQQAVPFLDRLIREPAFRAWIPLLLGRESESWYVAHRREAPDGSYSLQVFVWPPGSRTRVHDHSSWGAYRCALGTIFEERYERLDDGSILDHAHLRKAWERAWREGDGTSTVLPYEGGIHRIGNPGEKTAISVHLYGPRIGDIDGRDYDLSRAYVCDRRAA